MKTKLIKFIRAATRTFALCLLTAVAAFAYLFVGFVFTSQRRRRLQNGVRQFWARNVAAIIKMKIRVHGEMPDAPFFLVSNHLSYIDIIALMSKLNCVFVAKSDVADWFAIGGLARMAGTVFIDRTRNRSILPALEKIGAALKNRTGVVVFPEGTSTKGETVLPFKPSLLAIAAQEDLNVHYASLNYKTPDDCTPASLSVCWWGDMTFQDHFWRMCQLKEFEVVVRFGANTIKDEDRKVLAKKVWTAVNGQFVQTM